MNADNMNTFLHLLETTDKRMCRNNLYVDGAFCALGLCAHDLLGVPVEEMERGINNDPVYAKVAEYLGVPDETVWEINDSSLTFKEVAERLRTAFEVKA